MTEYDPTTDTLTLDQIAVLNKEMEILMQAGKQPEDYVILIHGAECHLMPRDVRKN